MKKTIVILWLLCVNIGVIFAQNTPWQLISPAPQAQPLNGICVISPDTLVAIGNNGTIIRSANGGVTWNVQQTVDADTDYFNAVQFVSKSVGWVVGDDGVVLKSVDGGFSWVDQHFPLPSTLLSLKFISATTGWITGNGGLIYKTTDGGTTWNPEVTNTKQTIFTIEFATSQIGFAFGTKGVFLKTTDGGTTWTQKTIDTTKTLYSCQFLSAQVGWAVGLSGYIIKTTNGGQTWGKQNSPILTSFFSIHFLDSLRGIIGGSIGSILRTTNGGINWTSVLPDLNDDIYGIHYSSSSVAWAVGDVGRILKSTDGGATWNLKSTGVKADLFASFYSSTNIGYSVGDTGVIIKTTDGGLSWFNINSSIYQPFYGIYFINDLNGWAAGDSGVILKTTDGGTTWAPKATGVENTLYSIYFTNSTDGWAVGDAGTILKSGNGGSSWSKVSGTSVPPASLILTKVHFLNSSVGLITASDGSIWKTTNGGTSWLPKSTGIEDYLYSISWPSDNIVYVVGDYGSIIQSTDAGETWNDLSVATPSSYYDVAFYNNQIGWAVGDDGEIISTTNSGQDWYEDDNPALTSFFSVQTVTSGSGALLMASGMSNSIVSSSINALTRRTWTGAADTLWANPLNWNPNGIPGRLDSVMVSASARQPVLNFTSQQIDIGTLALGLGATLKIKSTVATINCSGSISVNGSLNIESNAATQIITGGDLILNQSANISQGKSTFVCNGYGLITGTFNNLLVNSSATMYSVGNITVLNSIRVASLISMRQTDTLIIRNTAAQAFSGQGLVTPGTINRLITPGSVENYRFESSATSIQFLGTGVYPDSLLVTTYSNSKPQLLPDSLFSPISFLITPYGGSNPPASLCLRYLDSAFPDYNVSLFRDSSGILLNMGADEFSDGNYPGICLDTTYLYSRWYVGDGVYIPRLPYQFRNRLIVTDHGNASDTLVWGAQPAATTGIDAIYGESNLGSKPPLGTFDIRWRLSPTVSSKTDILPMMQSSSPTNTYTCEIQPGAGGFPVTVSWDSKEFPTGNIMLVDTSGGTKYKVYLKAQNSVVITDPTVTSIRIITRVPAYYSYNKNWNIFSLPQVSTVNPTKAYNYPLAVSSAFGYSNGYFVADTIRNGLGYWIKYADSITVPIEGDPLTTITIPVDSGWNLVGSIAQSVSPDKVGQSETNLLASPIRFYNYKAGYNVADSIRAGYGYWVKSNKEGSITLGGTAAKQSLPSSDVEVLSKLNSVVISDASGGQQQLYFGENDPKSNIALDSYELPPPPPPGILDASFDSRRMAAAVDYSHTTSAELPVFIQSRHYPVSLSVNFKASQIRSIIIVNSVTNKVLGSITPEHNKPVYISDKSVSKISLKLSYSAAALPKEFALLQNFPNPFNPVTTIRLELPVQSIVTLDLYNILGQRVKVLMSQEQLAAGIHDVTLDASSYASGVYFYQVRAQGSGSGSGVFHDVKKLLLIK